MAEVLLDIAQNASIRGMRVDGCELFSVHDFITYVCPGKNQNYSKTLWHRWISRKSQTDICKSQNEMLNEMFTIPEFYMCKFPWHAQKETPCMPILGLQKLLLILGSKAAVEFRDRVLECFNRVLAGDRTLIREIEANAARDGPVQQIARAALAEQATEERAGGGPATAGQVVAGECLELELAERRLELKRKAEDWEQSLVERQMALPLTIQRQKLELAATWVACMQQINPDWRADARLQLQAQDRLSLT